MPTIPLDYIPASLSDTDKKKQIQMLLQSRNLYKEKIYVQRDKVPSYKSKPSKHVANAMRIYNVENVKPSKEFAEVTGCSLSAL